MSTSLTHTQAACRLATWIVVMVLSASWRVMAQADAQFSQFWAVPAYYNPSAAGHYDAIHITAGSRLQWVGIKNAPMTFVALADMPYRLLNQRWGVGVSAETERLGLYRSTRVGAQLAWKRRVLKGTLSVGLQAGIISQVFKGERIVIPDGDEAHDSNDDAIPKTDVSGTAFDASVGLMYHHRRWWVAASVAHLTAPSITLKANRDAQEYYEFNVGRAYYLMAGGNIPIKNTLFEIQPSAMFKTDLNMWQAEANIRVRCNRFISGGVGYRYNDAVQAFFGVNIKDFFIGYSYDYPLSSINKATTGSHELFVTYNVKLDMKEKNKNKQKSIRLM